MTVCIAAVCKSEDGPGPAIVTCTDGKVSSAVGSAETGFKFHFLVANWYCLSAGIEAEIIALRQAIIHEFRMAQMANIIGETNAIDETNVMLFIAKAIRARKHEKADQFIGAKYGISYDEFLKSGKDIFPPEIYRDTMISIANINLRTELIMFGFYEGGTFICKTTASGEVRAIEQFEAVGEGEFLATAVLLHRAQHELDTVERTIYNVYEAKKYAERVASVGKETMLIVTEADRKTRLVNSAGIKKLEEMFKKYGPQEVTEELSLENIFDKVTG